MAHVVALLPFVVVHIGMVFVRMMIVVGDPGRIQQCRRRSRTESRPGWIEQLLCEVGSWSLLVDLESRDLLQTAASPDAAVPAGHLNEDGPSAIIVAQLRAHSRDFIFALQGNPAQAGAAHEKKERSPQAALPRCCLCFQLFLRSAARIIHADRQNLIRMDRRLHHVALPAPAASPPASPSCSSPSRRSRQPAHGTPPCPSCPPTHYARRIRPFASSAFFTAVSTTLSGPAETNECSAGSEPACAVVTTAVSG